MGLVRDRTPLQTLAGRQSGLKRRRAHWHKGWEEERTKKMQTPGMRFFEIREARTSGVESTNTGTNTRDGQSLSCDANHADYSVQKDEQRSGWWVDGIYKYVCIYIYIYMYERLCVSLSFLRSPVLFLSCWCIASLVPKVRYLRCVYPQVPYLLRTPRKALGVTLQ